MTETIPALLARFRAGEFAALARAISMVENGGSGFESLLAELHSAMGRAQRIGITGPPGAGKSTLVRQMVGEYRRRGLRVAVVAVDPTSPFSGGALLGDRIRMESVATDPGVFIRSMATRGATGGLALTTLEVCDVLDAFGFDRILVETVGIGQSELAIAATADTAVLVLVPESGDGIQVLKAGIMEVAHVYVVNKADRPGAGRLVREIVDMLSFRTRPEDGWSPVAVETVATEGAGVEELVDTLEERARGLAESGMLSALRRARLARHARDVVNRTVVARLWGDGKAEEILEQSLEQVLRGEYSVYELAGRIVASGERDDTHAASP